MGGSNVTPRRAPSLRGLSAARPQVESQFGRSRRDRRTGRVSEWPKETGCKPVGLCLRWFESSRAHCRSSRWSRSWSHRAAILQRHQDFPKLQANPRGATADGCRVALWGSPVRCFLHPSPRRIRERLRSQCQPPSWHARLPRRCCRRTVGRSASTIARHGHSGRPTSGPFHGRMFVRVGALV